MVTKATTNMLLLGTLFLIAVSIALLAYGQYTGGNLAQLVKEGGEDGGLTIKTEPDVRTFNDLSGTLSVSVQNSVNTSNTEYIATTARVYKSENLNELFGTITTIATGTGRGTLAVDKYDVAGNPQKYTVYVPTTDGTVGSGMFTISMGAEENKALDVKLPDLATLLFKVYDNEARAYVQETSELSAAGALNTTGKTWYSTTSNSTGLAVGSGGFFDYQVYISTNGTASTTTQFEDQNFLIAIDAQDLSDWQKPILTISGATITELAPGQYNDKIKNDGYDYVYKVTQNGAPLHVAGGQFIKLNIVDYAKAGVNPSDDIKIGLYSAGYYQHTLDQGMGMDTHKDDASQTAVITPQDLTLSLS